MACHLRRRRRCGWGEGLDGPLPSFLMAVAHRVGPSSTSGQIFLDLKEGPSRSTRYLTTRSNSRRSVTRTVDQAQPFSTRPAEVTGCAAARRPMASGARAVEVTNTGCMPEEERLYGTLRLLTLATLRLPDLAMIAQLVHIDATAGDPVVLCAAHDVAGGGLGSLTGRSRRMAATSATRSTPGSTTRCSSRASSSPATMTTRPHRPDAPRDPGAHGRHRRDRRRPNARPRSALGEHPTSVRLLPDRALMRAPVRPRGELNRLLRPRRSTANSRVCAR